MALQYLTHLSFFLSFHYTAVLLASQQHSAWVASHCFVVSSWVYLIKTCCLPDVWEPDVLLRGLPHLLTLQVCCRNSAPLKSTLCMRLGWNWPYSLHFCAWDSQCGCITIVSLGSKEHSVLQASYCRIFFLSKQLGAWRVTPNNWGVCTFKTWTV